MKKIYKIITFFVIFILISLFLGYKYFFNTKNYYVVIPHHGLVNKEIDRYYKHLSEQYKIDNIVIISPNHFGNNKNFYDSFGKTGEYCFQNNCLNMSNFDFYKGNIFTNKLFEHGIGNHFQFINKYFKNVGVYGITLKIKQNETKDLKILENQLKNYHFKGNTLFVASVDFSHHVNEKIAIFHDFNTYLNLNSNISKVEVDCPNCLMLVKNLATSSNKNYFNIFSRTSVDSVLKINSNFENTTHIFGEFTNKDNFNLDFLSGLTKKTNFNAKALENKKYVFGMFLGNLNVDKINKNLPIQDYLKCFYQNKDIAKNPDYWHNRMLYGFDFVGINILGNQYEKYLELLKKLGFNYFNNENDILEKEINGINFGVISSNLTQKENLILEISKLTKKGNLIVLNLDFSDKNYKKEMLDDFIKSGVKLIIINSKNINIESEIYKNTQIVYNIGNIIGEENKIGKFLVFAINKEKLYYNIVNYDFINNNNSINCETFR